MRRFDPLFGYVSAHERRAAESFFAELVGAPSRRAVRPTWRPRGLAREAVRGEAASFDAEAAHGENFEAESHDTEAAEPAVWCQPPARGELEDVEHHEHHDHHEDLEDLEGSPPYAAAGEAVVGQLSVSGQPTPVDTSATASLSGASFHDALLHALAQTTSHTAILGSPLGTGTSFAVHTWGPRTSLPSPLTVEFDAAGVAALVVNGGDRVYMQANPLATATADKLRWVHVPGLREFLRLPASQQTSQRNAWIDKILAAAPVDPATGSAFTRTALGALSTPTLRLLLAHNAAAAWPVQTVRRGTPSVDRGGVIHGVTLPMLHHPLSEPRVYLRVIAMREGKLESINAWDLEAGISLGPIQINCQRGTLFRFLWRVWEDDRALFQSTFGAPLAWTMRDASGYPELQVTVGTAQEWLRGRRDAADVRRNYAYFQSGDPTRDALAQLDPAFRRDLTARFRNLVAWPHVQGILEEVCAEWLQPGLDAVHRAGIPALDRNNPDRDTFVLKSLLLSTYVRFSGCLQPLLDALAPWTSVADKLANWRTAVAQMTGACNSRGTTAQQSRNANLVTRLGHQEGDARTVYAALQGVIAANRP